MSDDSSTPGLMEAWVREWIDSNPDGFNTMAPLFDAAREQDARLAALEADNARLRKALKMFRNMPSRAAIDAALAHDAAEGEPL